MSSDMMIICKEDDSGYDGKHPESALFVDECSMGEPWSAFGKWFGTRYCGAPGFAEQLMGIKEHDWIELTKADISAIKIAANEYEFHKDMDMPALLKYVSDHLGKCISTENW